MQIYGDNTLEYKGRPSFIAGVTFGVLQKEYL